MLKSYASLDKALYIYMATVLVFFALGVLASLYFVASTYGSVGPVGLATAALHMIFGVVFALGPVAQFNPTLRKNKPAVHRLIGKITLVAMVSAALFGLWMNLVPGNTKFGMGMRSFAFFYALWIPICAYRALAEARAKQFQMHRIWVTRLAAFAVGNGALRFAIIGYTLKNGGDTGIQDFVDGWIWFFVAGHSLMAELYIQYRFFTPPKPQPQAN